MAEVPNLKNYIMKNVRGLELGGGPNGPKLHYYESPAAYEAERATYPGDLQQQTEAMWKTGDLVIYGPGFDSYSQGLHEVQEWQTYGYALTRFVRQQDLHNTYWTYSDIAELQNALDDPEVYPGDHANVRDGMVYLRCAVMTSETQNGDAVFDQYWLSLEDGSRVESDLGR